MPLIPNISTMCTYLELIQCPWGDNSLLNSLKNIVPFQTYTYYLGYNPFPKESTTHGIEDGRDIALVGDHDSLTSHLGNMLIDLLQDRQVLFLQVASSLAKDPEYPRKDHNI
jgi:hypothetical protein